MLFNQNNSVFEITFDKKKTYYINLFRIVKIMQYKEQTHQMRGKLFLDIESVAMKRLKDHII